MFTPVAVPADAVEVTDPKSIGIIMRSLGYFGLDTLYPILWLYFGDDGKLASVLGHEMPIPAVGDSVVELVDSHPNFCRLLLLRETYIEVIQWAEDRAEYA